MNKLYIYVVIITLFGIVHPVVMAFERCTHACGTLHHKMANAQFKFEEMGSTEGYTESVPFALTGFGYGLASDSIVLPSKSPNPQLQSATANWIDFRFYASFPGIGFVKGSLNENHTSHVSLNALTDEGLFPSEFTNNMFIKLEPLAYPGLVYENTEALQLYAPSVKSAPPDSSIITTQIGIDTFRVVGSPPPGAPVEIIFKDGMQSFLETNSGLNLRLLSTSDDKLMEFRVENLLDVSVTVAYFLYFNGDSNLAEKVQDYDGIVFIEPQGYSEFSFDISDIPDTTPDHAMVQAMILEPLGLKGADLWVGSIPCYIELSYFVATTLPETKKNVYLNWRTGVEIRNAGFHLWRAVKDQYGGYKFALLKEFGHPEQVDPESNENCSTKIQGQLKEANPNQNHKLISAVGNSVESTCYSFTDTADLGDGTYYYLLEDIDDGGKSTFHCDHIDVVTIGQGPPIDLPSAISFCKKETGSED